MGTIRDWPTDERPREKLLSRGPAILSDAELLALLLRNGTRGRDAVAFARELLQDFGSLRTLLDADRATFCSRHGLGLARYAELQAVLELGRAVAELAALVKTEVGHAEVQAAC